MSVKDTNTSDLLDWTMTAALTADELAEALPPLLTTHTHPQHARNFSRWMWLTLGGVMLFAILGLIAYTWGNQRRVVSAVRETFLAEEAAALNGDTRALTALTAPGYSDWLKARLALAEQGMAAPAPALMFRPVTDAGEIISITTFAPDIMQVNLRRAFIGPEGETTAFLTTQFYQYQNGWKRTPTPPDFSGEVRQVTGPRVTITYFERDAELINELGPYFDELINSACAECNFNLSLQFLEERPAFDPITPLRLPAPHIIGTPANDASLETFKQALGQQVLLYVVQQFISSADGQRPNRIR